jgi:hypothetical protein
MHVADDSNRKYRVFVSRIYYKENGKHNETIWTYWYMPWYRKYVSFMIIFIQTALQLKESFLICVKFNLKRFASGVSTTFKCVTPLNSRDKVPDFYHTSSDEA